MLGGKLSYRLLIYFETLLAHQGAYVYFYYPI